MAFRLTRAVGILIFCSISRIFAGINLPEDRPYEATLFVDRSLNAYVSFSDHGNLAISKIDSKGVLLWTVDLPYGSHNAHWRFDVDRDENLYVTGETTEESGFHRIVVEKRDSNGSLLWHNVFGSGSGEHSPFALAQVDGSVYVAASTEGDLIEANSGGTDIVLGRVSRDGEVIWGRQLATSTFGTAVLSLVSDYSGGLYLVYGYGGMNTLRRYDSAGDLSWSFDFWGGFSTSVENNNSGDLRIVTGTDFVDAFSMLEAGQEGWRYRIGPRAIGFFSKASVDSSDNLYAIATMNEPRLSVLLTKLNANGEELWTRRWDRSLTPIDFGVTKSGNAYLFARRSGDAADGEESRHELLRLNTDGDVEWRITNDDVQELVHITDTAVVGEAILLVTQNTSLLKVRASGNIEWHLPVAPTSD